MNVYLLVTTMILETARTISVSIMFINFLKVITVTEELYADDLSIYSIRCRNRHSDQSNKSYYSVWKYNRLSTKGELEPLAYFKWIVNEFRLFPMYKWE